LAQDPRTAVLGAALGALRDMLASRIMPEDQRQLDDVASTLHEILDSDEAITCVRLALLEALGHLLVLKPDFAWPSEF